MKLNKELQDILNISSHCGNLPEGFVAFDTDDNNDYEFFIGTKNNFIDLDNGSFINRLNELTPNNDEIIILDNKKDKLSLASLDDIKSILKLCTVPLQSFKDDDIDTLDELHRSKIALLVKSGNECDFKLCSEVGYFNDFVETISSELKKCGINSEGKGEILAICKKYDKACKANIIPTVIDTIATLYELKLKYNLYNNDQVIGLGFAD